MQSQIAINNYILILLKSYEFANRPLGLQKIKIKNKKLTHPGKLYKVYIIVLGILTCVMALISLKNNYIGQFKGIPIPIMRSLIFNVIISIIGMLLIFINDVYSSNEDYFKIFILLSKVTDNLDFGNAEKRRYFEKFLKSLHRIVLVLKAVFYIPDLMRFRSFTALSFHLVIYILDMEMMHFVIETNLIARLFENMNSKLLVILGKNRNVQYGCLMKLWKTDFKTDEIILCPDNIFKLIQSCNFLLDVIDSMNYNYFIMVCIMNYIIRIFISLMFSWYVFSAFNINHYNIQRVVIVRKHYHFFLQTCKLKFKLLTL